MNLTHRLLALGFSLLGLSSVSRAEKPTHPEPTGVSLDALFADELWPKVAARSCLKCHRTGGDAEDSEFILRDPARDANPTNARKDNLDEFTKMARGRKDGQFTMLLKVVGKLDHGGEDVLKPESTRYRILEQFVRHANAFGATKPTPGGLPSPTTGQDADSFFNGVVMIENTRLLRRLTLSLGARLPTASEVSEVSRGELKALDAVLDRLMTEEAFYDRLAEGFNDIFLTTGYDDVAENALSYEHFEKTRHWYQKWDFSHIKDEQERKRAGWKLADQYREAFHREPMELVKHIVRNEKPFTELITADYIMVAPFTARGYGIFEEVKGRFKNSEDYLEFIPVKLKALKGRSRKTDQESATGFYPHAGILSTFQYMKRYPTTETNRNRLRVRMYFQHFLGIDIMQLAPRGNDAAAITAKYEIPTMQATDCVVCHKVIDPVAGLFQDYYALDGKGVYLRRQDGWYRDMFSPGHEGETLPDEERWRALQWLGERTAKDPRFAMAMVEHVWYILTGRRRLLPPEDIEDPLYRSRYRAFREQRDEFEAIARRFVAAKFNLKIAFKELAKSRFYRADGLATAAKDPGRSSELDDLGLVRLLAPEQLERKLKAVFGKDWGRLNEQFKILYGGIDTKEVTERIANPSGAMGAIQRMMANEMACKNVSLDFSLDPEKRRLFPGIELDVVPDVKNPKAEQKIRAAIVHLHQHVLGKDDTPDAAEVSRTYRLFSAVISAAQERKGIEPDERYHCRVESDRRLPDPHYTLRAWRAVLTYLLRQHDFLYE